MYCKTTHEIKVSVAPVYADANSNNKTTHVWVYHVLIENLSQKTVQLKSRYWRIYDAHGKIEEVSGEGVIGKQPVLHPNEMFEYSSYVSLTTETGMMSGKYLMANVNNHEEVFEVEIPAFSIETPFANFMIN